MILGEGKYLAKVFVNKDKGYITCNLYDNKNNKKEGSLTDEDFGELSDVIKFTPSFALHLGLTLIKSWYKKECSQKKDIEIGR